MTTELAPAPAHQFEDLDQQHDASSLGMWAFLATEVMFFGGLFTGFAVYRATSHEAFSIACQQLDVPLGTINTCVLLTSSLTMALAVRAGQEGDRKPQVRFLLLTMLFGAAFLGIKGVEYYHEFEKHLVPGFDFNTAHLHLPTGASEFMAQRAEMFFVFYFFMTALHAVHMIIGLAILAWMVWLARRGRFTPHAFTPLEMTGLYWHFIDIVWVFLFPTLYLIDLH